MAKKGARRNPVCRQGVFMLLGGVLLVAVCGCSSAKVTFLNEPQKTKPRVLVVNFSFARKGEASELLFGNVEAGYVGEMVADDVRQALRRSGCYEVVPRRELRKALQILGFAEKSELTKEEAAAVAKLTQADLLVMGRVEKCRLTYFIQLIQWAEVRFEASADTVEGDVPIWRMVGTKSGMYVFPDELTEQICRDLEHALTQHHAKGPG